MVARQLRGRDITDERVLAAMAAVPRHLFVPPELQEQAYANQALPIGHAQTISQPYVVALMTQLLALHGGERVLEIGTGSGYQAAVLSHLAGAVYSIEIDPELAEKARTTLASARLRRRACAGRRWLLRLARGRPVRRHHHHRRGAAHAGSVAGTVARRRPRHRTARTRRGEELAVGIKHGDRLDWTEHGGVRFVPMTGEVRRTPSK